MAEDTLEGFKVAKYPNLVTGEDETLYVCNVCRPQWDTFDKAAARAHLAAGNHDRLDLLRQEQAEMRKR